MGLLVLTLIISGLALHGWLLIEMQLNGIAFSLVVFSGAVLNGIVKLDRIVDAIKNTFFNKSKYFRLYYIIFSIKYWWMYLISSTIVES